MTEAGNQPTSKTVEHLIPNTAVYKKRGNGEGDFFACKDCNSKKSHIDFVLGKIVKFQSNDPELAANALAEAVSREEGRSKRFVEMVLKAKPGPSGIHLKLPINYKEIIEYLEFLCKGQFFRVNKEPLNPMEYVMEFKIANKAVMSYIERNYEYTHGSNPFLDIQKNKCSESINGGECVIFSEQFSYLFFFHNYFVIIARVLKRTWVNTKKSKKSYAEIKSSFS